MLPLQLSLANDERREPLVKSLDLVLADRGGEIMRAGFDVRSESVGRVYLVRGIDKAELEALLRSLDPDWDEYGSVDD